MSELHSRLRIRKKDRKKDKEKKKLKLFRKVSQQERVKKLEKRKKEKGKKGSKRNGKGNQTNTLIKLIHRPISLILLRFLSLPRSVRFATFCRSTPREKNWAAKGRVKTDFQLQIHSRGTHKGKEKNRQDLQK